MIPRDYHNNLIGTWTYYPPKWYHLRYRGGRFVFFQRANSANKEYKDIHKNGLEFGEQLRKNNTGTWFNKTVDGYSRYEVTVVACKSKEDAAIFKLAVL